MAVLGLDIGTTRTKCQVFGEDGSMLSEASGEFPLLRRGGESYLDIRALTQKVFQVIGQAAKASPQPPGTICISSLGESFVPVDKNGALADVMLYSDPRGKEEAESLTAALGAERILRIAGVRPKGIYSLPKMMWLKEHQPEIYRKADKLLLVGDYAGWLLTGQCGVGLSLAARSMALDVRTRTWSGELLDAAGIPVQKFSLPLPPGEEVGKVRPDLCRELGLAPGCRVVAGGHDQSMAAIGAGALASGSGINGMGTVDCITHVFDQPCTDPAFADAGFVSVPYVEGRYVSYAFSLDGGGLLNWFRDKLTENRAYEEGFYDHFESRLSEAPSGLLFLPYLSGSATPYFDERAVGAVVGLTQNTDLFALYRAVLESTSFEMKLNLDVLSQSKVAPDRLLAAGGCSRSDVWLQIRADILGLPITRLFNHECGLCGAAMLCAVADGAYPDLEAAAAAFVREGPVFVPDPRRQEAYLPHYERYKKLYPALKALRS